jgi:hypothetical protein
VLAELDARVANREDVRHRAKPGTLNCGPTHLKTSPALGNFRP